MSNKGLPAYLSACLPRRDATRQVFLVVLQTLAANVNCIKDASVHSYCLGVLYNTTPHAHALHSVCCQRLLALISGLRQRYMQYVQQVREMQLEASEWVSKSYVKWAKVVPVYSGGWCLRKKRTRHHDTNQCPTQYALRFVCTVYVRHGWPD